MIIIQKKKTGIGTFNLLRIKLLIFGILVINYLGCVTTYKLPTASVNHNFDNALINKTIGIHKQNNIAYSPNSKDEVLYYLDMGMLYYYAGNYKLSNDLLTKAELSIENNFTKSLSQYGASLILDDRSLNYYGEDYEDIYLNVFKSLNYIKLDNFEAAGVEIRRVNEKLTLLQDKYDKLTRVMNSSENAKKIKRSFKTSNVRFYNSALSRYISSICYCHEREYDDARIDIQHIYSAFRQQRNMYGFSIPKRILKKYKCLDRNEPEICLKEKSSANINVISFTGRMPEKKIKTYWIITKKNCIFIANKKNGSGNIDVISWPGIKSGYHLKFALPYLEKRKNYVKTIAFYIDNKKYILEKLEDMANIAMETFNHKKNLIYLKTIVRATIKGIIAADIKRKIENKYYDKKTKKKKTPSWGDLLWIEAQKLIIDAIVEAIENADKRASSFFPALAYMGNFDVKPGYHNIKIVYFNKNNKVIKIKDYGKQLIKLNGLNLFQSSFYGIN